MIKQNSTMEQSRPQERRSVTPMEECTSRNPQHSEIGRNEVPVKGHILQVGYSQPICQAGPTTRAEPAPSICSQTCSQTYPCRQAALWQPLRVGLRRSVQPDV